MKKKHWLCLEPYTYISTLKDTSLIYNTLNGQVLEYENVEVGKLLKKLTNKNNLYVIKITEKDLAKTEVSNFVDDIRENFMGDIIYNNSSTLKPIQIAPELKIQKNIALLKNSPGLSIGRESMRNLIELTILINDSCKLSCYHCGFAYKQFTSCSKKNTTNELNIDTIEKLVNELKGSYINRVNITGGNLLSYHKLDEFNHLIENTNSIKFGLYLHYKNVLNNQDKLKLLRTKKILLHILIDFPINWDAFKVVKNCIESVSMEVNYQFIISEIQECEELDILIKHYKIKNYILLPYFNKTNYSFFEKFVFTSKKDISKSKISQNDIYSRKHINAINFGKLHIKSDGNIYSNLNSAKIGNIKYDSLNDSVYKELKYRNNWTKSRNNVFPCKSCLYKLLCPPISNYEYFLGKHDLCTIRRMD